MLGGVEMTCPHQILPEVKISEQKEGCHCFGPLSSGVVCYVVNDHFNHMVDCKWPHILCNSAYQEVESSSPALKSRLALTSRIERK